LLISDTKGITIRGRRKKNDQGRNEKADLRANRQIRIKDVYLIDENGEPIGEFSTFEALKRAEAVGLDLVEISPNARPPVCKIMDYGKFKYRQQKKNAAQKTHQAKVKEVRLHPRTDEHDVVVRIKQAERFLNAGDKVLFSVQFKGREIVHKEFGYRLLERFREEFKLMAKIEKDASMEGRNRMTMLLAPLAADKRKKLEREAEEAAIKEERESGAAGQRRVISREEAKAAEATGNESPESVKETAEAGE